MSEDNRQPAATSANRMELAAPGVLVQNTGVWFRLTHRLDGRWYGVRLGSMGREEAEAYDQPRVGTCIWPVPLPFLF